MRRHEIATHRAIGRTAPERLAAYKREAAHLDELAAHSGVAAETGCNPHDWRSTRYHYTPAGAATTRGTWQEETRGAERAYYTDTAPAGWRIVGNASDIVDRLPDGYYSDNEQRETFIAAVLQLPSRHGHPQFVPAIYHTDACGVTSWPLDRYDTKEEAAREADGYAERAAEAEREYREKDDAEQRILELRDDIAAARAEHSAICVALQPIPRVATVVRATMRRRLAQLRDELRDAANRIKKLTDEPWRINE